MKNDADGRGGSGSGRSSIPRPIDRHHLAEALSRDRDVEAVWLFGFRARGDADALSDVDIAVLARPHLAPADLFDKQLDWTTLAAHALQTDEVGLLRGDVASHARRLAPGPRFVELRRRIGL